MSGGIFALQFNTNANILKGFEERIFAGAEHSAVVICAFQEYDLAPVDQLPLPVLLLTSEVDAEPCPLQREAYMRYRKSDITETDEERLASIKAAIGSSFELVADVAMGETAGMIKVAEEGKKKLEWYGHIRLIIFARPDLPAGATLCMARDKKDMHACVIPCGDKGTGNPLREGAALDEPDSQYPKGMSPDKGAVCIYFPSAKLMVVSSHLHGTNKPLPELDFNIIRERQLRRIGSGLTWLAQQHAKENEEEGEGGGQNIIDASELKCTLLFCGDLNFRVESEFVTPEDKEKGGKDFQYVEPLASSENFMVLSELMENNDLFYRLLRKSIDDIPPVLVRTRDAVAETVCKRRTILPPTFTYTQDAPYPRPYKNKRTPSWPDRILFRDLGFFFEQCHSMKANEGDITVERSATVVAEFIGATAGGGVSGRSMKRKLPSLRHCSALKEVVCSDHEAIVTVFGYDEPLPHSSSFSNLWHTFDETIESVTGQVGDTVNRLSCSAGTTGSY